MYILIFESGEVKKAKEISEDDILSVVDGYLDIVDISNPEFPKYIVRENGTWDDLESADE